MPGAVSFGIYIHIPVCSSLCGYCDFYSIKNTDIDDGFWKRYLEKLKIEFGHKQKHIGNKYFLTSIYFGGGTPSLAPDWFISNIINFCLEETEKKFSGIEKSLEANPETMTEDILSKLHAAGINRLSVGVQSFDDKMLKILDRGTTPKAIYRTLELIAGGPVPNWSGDLIYGIPGQTSKMVLSDAHDLVGFSPAHISAYSLTMESNRLGNKSISEHRQAFHQELLWPFFEEHGFEQYEVSNFARNKKYCLHNLSVWKYRPYLSLGPSGHSFLDDLRFRTVSDIGRYLKEPVENILIVERSRPVPDLFITALRLRLKQRADFFTGILPESLSKNWNDVLRRFARNNWLEVRGKFIRITPEGLSFSNTMLEEVYAALS